MQENRMTEEDLYYSAGVGGGGGGTSDAEVDSDQDDQDAIGTELGNWLGHLEQLSMGLDADLAENMGTVKRRTKTVVTPKMAMDSFRCSFLNDEESEEVNLDTILGELCELESQITFTQSQLSQTLKRHAGGSQCAMKEDNRDSGTNDFAQAELEALCSEITEGSHFLSVSDIGCTCDSGETDSAFSDNVSLPSCESFTSMTTVSSSADTSSSADSISTYSANTLIPAVPQHSEEQQKARVKAEKIRIALEKIKDAKIRKLFVRAFTRDGSSKSILVDEKMTVGNVCSILAEKNHVSLDLCWTVIEHIPDLSMERVLEDHDSLVENMVLWTRDSKNKILFESRPEKYNLFHSPEKYLLLGSSSEKGVALDPSNRNKLIQEFFDSGSVPEVEGILLLKSDGKKVWKKYFFVLRASGLYYNPKGKISKASKDLHCLVQFDFVEVYRGISWKKKYNAHTDYCFALKHPQIQKKCGKYIQYLCAENKAALDMWIMGIRIAKFGKQLLQNYEKMQTDIACWDMRDPWINTMQEMDIENLDQPALNHRSLADSRLSEPPEPDRHSIVTITSSSPLQNNSPRRSSASVIDYDCCVTPHSVDGSRRGSLTPQGNHDSPQKTPVKRVSFSTMNSVIHADTGEETIQLRHRDSIVSASTDTSDASSNSSGDNNRTLVRSTSRLRARIPITTDATRQISGMVQTAMETNIHVAFADSSHTDRKSAASQSGERLSERRKSAPSIESPTHEDNSQFVEHSSHGSQIYSGPLSQSKSGKSSSPAGHSVQRHNSVPYDGANVSPGANSPTATYSQVHRKSSGVVDIKHHKKSASVSSETLGEQYFQYQQQQQQRQSTPPAVAARSSSSTPPISAVPPNCPPLSTVPPHHQIFTTSMDQMSQQQIPHLSSLQQQQQQPVTHSIPSALAQQNYQQLGQKRDSIKGHNKRPSGGPIAVPPPVVPDTYVEPVEQPSLSAYNIYETIPVTPPRDLNLDTINYSCAYIKNNADSSCAGILSLPTPPSPAPHASDQSLGAVLPPPPLPPTTRVLAPPTLPKPGQQQNLYSTLPALPQRYPVDTYDTSRLSLPPPPPPPGAQVYAHETGGELPPPPPSVVQHSNIAPAPNTQVIMSHPPLPPPPPPPPSMTHFEAPLPPPPPSMAPELGVARSMTQSITAISPPSVCLSSKKLQPTLPPQLKCVSGIAPPSMPPSTLPKPQLSSADLYREPEYGVAGPLPFLAELSKRQHGGTASDNTPGAGGDIYANIDEVLEDDVAARNHRGHSPGYSSNYGALGSPDLITHLQVFNGSSVVMSQPPLPPVPHQLTLERTLPTSPCVMATGAKPRFDPSKSLPPPPPKRSESTRLSTRGPRPVAVVQSMGSSSSPPTPTSSSRSSSSSLSDSSAVIYKSSPVKNLKPLPPAPLSPTGPAEFEGILPIDDLPPPPPELLEVFEQESDNAWLGKPKPPPPPPKRNRDTQLTH